MRRVIAALSCAVALAGALAPGAAAATPAIYHTIKSTTAYAEFSHTDGCLQTDVWVSSTNAMFASQPGPLNKQGLTAVAIRVSDACAPPVGKGYPALFDGEAQTFDRLVATPRLTEAAISAVVPVQDAVSGTTSPVTIAISWTRTGPLEHSTVHNHVRFPWAGNVSANDNNLMAPADASGSVKLNGDALVAAGSGFAMLQQVKSTCREIRFPHYTGDSYWCF